MVRIFSIIALLVTAAFADYSAHGHVKDPSGQGLEGVSVTGVSPYTFTYTTVSGGFYEFLIPDPVPAGQRIAFFMSGPPGYYADSCSFPIYGPDSLPNKTFSLLPHDFILRWSQTINFPALPNRTYQENDTIQLGATATSGLTVIYSLSPTTSKLQDSVLSIVPMSPPGKVAILGTGATTIWAKQSGNSSYGPAPIVSRTLVVNKATASITLSGLTATYDGTPKVVTATTVPAGLIYGIKYDGSTTAPSAAGSYAILCTLSNANKNYQGTATGTLVISKISQTITFGSLSEKTYGDVSFSITASASSGLSVSFSSSNTSVATVSGNTITIVGAGNANITASQAGDAAYSAAPDVVQGLTVNKASATVTLSGLSHVYDGTVKSASAVTNPVGLVVNLGYSSSPLDAGSYTVTATINDANYQGNTSGTLVIDKATAIVTLGNLSHTYDGTVKSASASTTPVGLTVNLSYSSSPIGAGSYTVTGTISNANYQGSASSTLVISKATATVTLSGLNHGYDGSPKQVTATTVPNGLSVTATYNGSSTAPSAVGSYAVVVTVNSGNYQGGASGTMTISVGLATVLLSNLNVVYDGTAKSATVSTTPAGLPVTITYNGSPTVPINAGTYAVVATVSSPYQGRDSSTLTIAKASQVIVFDTFSVAKRVGDSLSLSAMAPAGVVSLASSDTAVAKVSGSKVTFIGAGYATITASQAGNGNYNAASSVTRVLTAVGKPVLLTPDSVTVKGGSNVSYKAGYSVPGNFGAVVTVVAPSWLTVVGDSAYGKAPNVNRDDTVWVIVSVKGFSDTLKVIIHIKASTGVLVNATVVKAHPYKVVVYDLAGRVVFSKELSSLSLLRTPAAVCGILKVTQDGRTVIRKTLSVR